MAIAVKRYTSIMTGAPTLNGTAGSLVTVLDACLKDGYNTKAPTDATRSETTATLNFGSAHGYAVNDVIALSGATGSGNDLLWNDEFRVLTASTNSLTFAISADATTPAAGTLSCKIAPLGWSKPFSGTNKAAYLPKAQYVQCYLRVLDDSTVPISASGRWAKLRGYETMTDVDTGTGLFPTAAQSTNALSLCKSSTSDSTARAWWLAGDGGIFYMGTFWYAPNNTLAAGYCFGDIQSLRSGDAYSCLLIADQAGSDTLPSGAVAQNNFCSLSGNLGGTQAGKYLARSYNQLGSALLCGMVGDPASSGYLGYSGIAYPHPVDNGLVFAPLGILESSAYRSRALPGIYAPLHNAPLSYLDVISDLPDLPGRKLQAFDLAYSANRAQCLIDIVGPWR
jgi:hypothetical protein